MDSSRLSFGKGYLGLIRNAVIEFNIRIEYFRLQRAERERVEGGTERSIKGGGGHEGREVDGLKERQKTRTSCVIGKASD